MDKKYWDENGNLACVEEIKECNNLDELFNLWKEAQRTIQTEEKCLQNTGRFTHDRYIDENKYKEILFILKEANVGPVENQENNPQEIEDDYQIEFYKYFFKEELDDIDKEKVNQKGKNNDENKYKVYMIGKDNMIYPKAWENREKKNRYFDNAPKQKEKIARMARYILNNKEITSDYNELCEALKSVAFMNINKMGGTNSTNDKNLRKYYEKYKEFIKKEVEIIKPKIIVDMTHGCISSEDFENIAIVPMIHTAARGKNINLDKEGTEEAYFNKNIAKNIGIDNWKILINNYTEYENNIFNKDKKGPFVKFNRSTLKYLVKFIKRYECSSKRLDKK